MERSEALKWALWPIGILLALAGLWYFAGPQRDLWRCDDAIRDQLRAPSTYNRVDASEVPGGTMRSYRVTFEAQNAFGVPLRGSASCYFRADGSVSAYVSD